MTNRPRNIEEESEAIEDAIEDGYAHHASWVRSTDTGANDG